MGSSTGLAQYDATNVHCFRLLRADLSFGPTDQSETPARKAAARARRRPTDRLDKSEKPIGYYGIPGRSGRQYSRGHGEGGVRKAPEGADALWHRPSCSWLAGQPRTLELRDTAGR